MHLLNVGDIDEDSPRWQNLSKSEQRQRQEGRKERRWRINNSNFAIHPQRLSIRNMPTFVDANKLREVVVKNLAEVNGAEKRKERQQLAQSAVVKACLVRDKERREESGARRSKGFAFIAFKDHDSAMKTLQFLNDNPQAFGGGRRPIVEFAVEDKRKLRMQEEERKRSLKRSSRAKKAKTGKKGKKGQKGQMVQGRRARRARRRRMGKSLRQKLAQRGSGQSLPTPTKRAAARGSARSAGRRRKQSPSASRPESSRSSSRASCGRACQA
ncbi:unnamed protein product [Effrenium voratum]|nr:unnamed protein product [Effrenium voratum]